MLILFFFIIGVTTLFIEKPSQVIIPAVIFGTIFYFVKHPEKLKNFSSKSNYKHPPTKPKPKMKPKDSVKKRSDHPFTVIDGNKEKKQKTP